MYLSRILLDLHHPSVRQALRNCNDMHRNLMCAFPMPDTLAQARRDIGLLYRLVTRRDEIYLLVSSEGQPDRRVLLKNGCVLDESSPKDVSGLQQVFQSGLTLCFDLVAAPCKKVDSGGKNSKRVFLRTPDERMDWLRRQGTKYGFDLYNVQEGGQQFTVNGIKQAMRIHYDAMRFIGVLCVTDQQSFWQGYSQGIGPGKTYGLGMLTVGRA